MGLNVKSAGNRDLRKELRFGDVAQIASDCNVSTVTVQSALAGKISTEAGRVVVEYTKKLIEDRQARLEYLKKVIKPLYK